MKKRVGLEHEWETSLQKACLADLTQYRQNTDRNKATPWNTFVEQLKGLAKGQKAYGREIAVEGILGEFQVRGQIYFVLVLWESDRLKIRLVEGKASRKERLTI